MKTWAMRLTWRASIGHSAGRQAIVTRSNAFARPSSHAAQFQKLSDGPTRGKFVFRPLLRQRLGIGANARVAVYDDDYAPIRGLNVPARSSVFEQFQRNCVKSNRRGLACHLDAILATAQALPFIPMARLKTDMKANIDGRWVRRCGLTGSFDRRRDNIVSVAITPAALQNLQCNIVEADGGTDSISHCFLVLFVTHDPNASKSTALPTEDVGAEDEMAYVSEVFAMVVKRFCSEMTFPSREEATSILAEALLHVLKLRTPTLYVNMVKIVAQFEGEGSDSIISFTATARWKSSEKDTADRSEEAEVVVEKEARGSNEAREDEEYEEEEDEADDQDSMEVSASEPPSITPGPAEAEETLASFVRTIPGSGKIELCVSDLHSQNIVGKLGMHVHQLSLTWGNEHEQAACNVRKSDLVRTLETSVARAGGRGFRTAAFVGQAFADELPGQPQVTLCFKRLLKNAEYAQGSPHKVLDLVIRRNGISDQNNSTLTVPGSLLHEFHGEARHKQPADLVALYKFSFTDHGAIDDENIPNSARRLRDAVEPYIAPIIQENKTQNINVLANQCATAMVQLLDSTNCLLKFSSACVKLYASREGNLIEKAESAQMLEKPGAESARRTDEIEPRETEALQGAVMSMQEDAKPEFVTLGSDTGSKHVKDSIFVALGSNLGDRFAAIESACRRIDEDPDMRIVATSSLFETDPMYVQDQDRFLNGVCQIETQLEPMDLLDRLQAIENNLGRVKIIDKGPRNIDLDIVAYGQQQISTDRLIVPHRLMLEREFVLRPMFDLAFRFRHPATGNTIERHLARLPPTGTPMYPLTPLAPGVDPLRSLDPGQKTLIMSILNVTPDSFSDGGQNQPADLDGLKATVAAHIAAGATIIDIGGQSSRPNAADITAEEELARILPAIEAIKSLPEASKVAIAIDTYRAQVAEAAINAGAHIVNDISAGLLDPDMLPTVARLGCTYIMMHMRGTPHNMQNEENTSYPKGVMRTIAEELQARLEAAQAAGIRRWRIILDPGVGFAKTTEQNLDILRKMYWLRRTPMGFRTLPWLVGSSRKGFIGKITEVEKADERVGGTAVTVAAAVAGKAEIVRVHDVQEMARVVKMADALYKAPVDKKSLME